MGASVRCVGKSPATCTHAGPYSRANTGASGASRVSAFPIHCMSSSTTPFIEYVRPMLLLDAPITLREAMSKEPSLADIFKLVLSQLSVCGDAALFGAQAVNAYVEPPRMTADLDILSTDAEKLSHNLRDLLSDTFRIAVRVRVVAQGKGFRIYQLRAGKNRHLVDLRQVDELPQTQRISGVCVVSAPDLVVMKLASFVARRNTDKGISDRLDLHRLLLAFPHFRSVVSGPVVGRLRGASPDVWAAWQEILSERIERSDDDEY